jgi:hypothetical protein
LIESEVHVRFSVNRASNLPARTLRMIVDEDVASSAKTVIVLSFDNSPVAGGACLASSSTDGASRSHRD